MSEEAGQTLTNIENLPVFDIVEIGYEGALYEVEGLTLTGVLKFLKKEEKGFRTMMPGFRFVSQYSVLLDTNKLKELQKDT